MTSWVGETRSRLRELQDILLSTGAWARESGLGAEDTEHLLAPYREMLDTLYERDLPLAKLADQSDILLHVRGPAASGPVPRVSVVTHMLSQTRDEVTRLAKKLGGIVSLRVPASLDMGFVGVAEGSLFVGFAAIDSGEEAALTRRAVEAIGEIGSLISEDADLGLLVTALPDPADRDLAITAIRHLSPSGQLGISEVEVLGRSIKKPVSLTTQTRRHARKLMAEPDRTRSLQRYQFVGTVREVDLDAARFEIRNVEGQIDTSVRCAHELAEEEVKGLVDHRVRVTGLAETAQNGTVRLLWVDELEPLDRAPVGS